MSISDAIIKLAKRVFNIEISKIRTHIPAQVISFDADNNSVKLQPCINLITPTDTENKTKQMSVIDDVPVQQFGSGKILFSVAPAANSYGMLHVFDRSVEHWIKNGGIANPANTKKFDVSDCVFVPGLYPFASDGDNGKLQSSIKTDRIELRLRDGSAYISLLDDGSIKCVTSSGKQFDINGNFTVDV